MLGAMSNRIALSIEVALIVVGAAACRVTYIEIGSNLGGGGATSTTGATSSNSSNGGTGGAPQCTPTDTSACPPVPPGPCASLAVKTCTDQVCGVAYKPWPAPSQEYGSCKKNMCDANGLMTSVEDDTNVFISTTCSPFRCVAGHGDWGLSKDGAACAAMGGPIGGVCVASKYSFASNTEYVCGQCDSSTIQTCSAFPGTVCTFGFCLPAHCSNHGKDANETDVDCGGPDCFPCGAGRACHIGADCGNKVCTGSVCQVPSCSDGVQNGQESDVDCGYECNQRCPVGAKCYWPGDMDCESGVCMPMGPDYIGRCQAPTCTDGVKNGDETGMDCGGSTCPPCPM